MLSALSDILVLAQKQKRKEVSGQFSLFEESQTSNLVDHLPDLPEFSQREILNFEKELLGFYLTSHPMLPLLKNLGKVTDYQIADLDPNVKKILKIGGVITKVRRIITKNNNSEMAFVRIEDLTGSIELVIFPSIFAKTRSIWQENQVVLVAGKLDFRNERLSFIVDKVSLLTQ